MSKEDEPYYTKEELSSDVEGFLADATLLKKFANTFGSGDGLDVFEYIVDRICTAFNVNISGEKEAARQEVGLTLWELAMKADVEICCSLMRRWALKYQGEKKKQLNKINEENQDG